MRTWTQFCLVCVLFFQESCQFSRFSSEINPETSWLCRSATATEEAKGSALSLELIKADGGCMPDATCRNSRSNWTNLFG